jgi:hypothetical protein
MRRREGCRVICHREHEVHREDTEGKLDPFVVEQPQRNERGGAEGAEFFCQRVHKAHREGT